VSKRRTSTAGKEVETFFVVFFLLLLLPPALPQLPTLLRVSVDTVR
jgi:hypothetical protein